VIYNITYSLLGFNKVYMFRQIYSDTLRDALYLGAKRNKLCLKNTMLLQLEKYFSAVLLCYSMSEGLRIEWKFLNFYLVDKA